MNSKVDYLLPDEEYNPKQPDWDKVKNYKNVEYVSITITFKSQQLQENNHILTHRSLYI